jgi:hypothetical protein
VRAELRALMPRVLADAADPATSCPRPRRRRLNEPCLASSKNDGGAQVAPPPPRSAGILAAHAGRRCHVLREVASASVKSMYASVAGSLPS